MASFVNLFNLLLFFLFSLCYMYQVVYAVVVLVADHKRKVRDSKIKQHKYAVLIAGRNEETVIGELVKSIKDQNYPAELVDIYVIADNCTDSTADVAKAAGANVLVRNNKEVVGKSHALDFALHRIITLNGNKQGRTDYAGYFVFDADNILHPDFISSMNETYAQGYQVITSYRNSKNFDSNWVSAGSAMWFLREAKFLSRARQLLSSSCAIGGTGFFISADILETNGGWIHHLLTEDIEFSADCIANGIQIGYCQDAIIYDEQPTTMRDSWRQRLRWAKGFYQVLLNYGGRLFSGIFKKEHNHLSCFDMFMTIAPAMLLTIVSFLANFIFCVIGLIQLGSVAAQVQIVAGSGSLLTMNADANWLSSALGMLTGSIFQGDALSNFNTANASVMLNYADARATLVTSFISLAACFLSFGFIMFAFGLLTTICEWDKIHASKASKIRYTFTFPIFMLTYVPIALVAVFKKVEWKPIKHNVVRSVADVVGSKEQVLKAQKLKKSQKLKLFYGEHHFRFF